MCSRTKKVNIIENASVIFILATCKYMVIVIALVDNTEVYVNIYVSGNQYGSQLIWGCNSCHDIRVRVRPYIPVAAILSTVNLI